MRSLYPARKSLKYKNLNPNYGSVQGFCLSQNICGATQWEEMSAQLQGFGFKGEEGALEQSHNALICNLRSVATSW